MDRIRPTHYDTGSQQAFLRTFSSSVTPSVRREVNLRYNIKMGTRGGVVVKALRYKPAGRGFDYRCCHSKFSVTQSFRSHCGPGVDSASNRNEYQVYFLVVKAAGA